jgi:ABC-2 type transport system ATP-binding protein
MGIGGTLDPRMWNDSTGHDSEAPDGNKRTREAPMAGNAIEITALRKTYASSGSEPPKEALKGIDLAIPQGSIFGLLGPNGAGKSTLINILAGLVVKTSGTVRIWGFDQDVNPRQSRASIGVMPQELNIDPFFTPRAALEVQAGLYGVPKARRRTDEILAMIGLSDKAGAYARTLSGGMRRRLLLGKALVHRPPILVLDEPTAGVDIELRQMLWENVRKLNAEGMTVILTTHYLEEAEEMCDEVAIINHGQVVARDSTAALLGRMDAKTLVVQGEDPASADIALPDGCTATMRRDGALAISYRRGRTSPEEILAALRAAGVRLRDVATEEPDLQDVFLDLTRSRPGAA